MSHRPDNNPARGSDYGNEHWWHDKPAYVKLLLASLAVICAALFLADFLYHKHGHFGFEQWPGFYAWYGCLSYCAIVLTAKQLRKFLSRSESYYESEDSDASNEIPSLDSSQRNASDSAGNSVVASGRDD